MRGRLHRLFERYGKKAWLFIGLGVVLVVLLGGGAYAAFGGTILQSSSSNVDLQKGLIGWWKMDGNAKDSTPYGNDGTVTAATLTADRQGKANSAYLFDSSSDLVRVAPAAVHRPAAGITMSVWINTSNVEATTVLSIAGNLQSGGYNMVINSNGAQNCPADIKFNVYVDDAQRQTCTPETILADGTWAHIVGTFDGAAVRLYVNNVLKDTNTFSGSITYSSLTTPMCIGLNPQSSSCSGSPFQGSMDDLRIYDRALNTAEIEALYTSYDSGTNIGNGQSGLVGHWKMDGNAKDSTPYANNGTVTGATLTSDRKGRPNSAYAFSFPSKKIELPSSTVLNTSVFTFSAWINLPSWGPMPILGSSAAGGPNISFNNDGYLGLMKEGVATISRIAITIPDGRWVHVAVSYDSSGTAKFYIDGVPVGGSTNLQSFTFSNFTIGKSTDFFSQFIGSMDDIRLYNRVLSDDEIKSQYESYDSQINLNSSPTATASGGNINAGLVGYWPFSGSAKDATPFSGNGTVNGGASLATDRFGRSNSAYNFTSASQQYISIPDSPDLSPASAVTIAAWFKGTVQDTTYGANDIAGILNKNIGGSACANPIYGFNADTGSLYFGTCTTTNHYVQAVYSGLLDDTWYFAVGTYDGATQKLYINGSLVDTRVDQSGSLDDSNGALHIGRQKSGFTRFFEGTVDDVRVYNRALSLTEVQTLYQSQI